MNRIFGSFFLVAASTAPLWASCGAATCSLETFPSFSHEKGVVQLGYIGEYIDQNQPRIETRKAEVGEISGHHDEQRTINRLHRFTGLWGATERLSLETSIPLISRSHRHIHNHHGTPIPTGWDFTGIGDILVQSRLAFYKPAEKKRPTMSILTGIEFPTGESDMTNSDGNSAEPGITPGSDSYDFLLGIASMQELEMPTLMGMSARAPLFFSATYKLNTPGREEYRIGDTLSVNMGMVYPLTPRIGLSSQLNLAVKERDDQGETHEEIGKTGGEYLYLSPGFLIQLAKHWEWHTVVQCPIYQRVNQIQLTSDYNLQTGLSFRFRI